MLRGLWTAGSMGVATVSGDDGESEKKDALEGG
jgi:hypothetical protein